MPPFGTRMSNDQVAAVVNYVRTHFGNSEQDTIVSGDAEDVRSREGRTPYSLLLWSASESGFGRRKAQGFEIPEIRALSNPSGSDICGAWPSSGNSTSFAPGMAFAAAFPNSG
jgi:hypothetical protein